MRLHEVNNNSVMDLQNRAEQEVLSDEEIQMAKEEGRIIQGVFNCAQALEMDPDSVTMCILNEGGGNDISVHIQHTLIEAYCWENEISIQKVGPEDKLSILLANEAKNLNKNVENHSCALVMASMKDIDNEHGKTNQDLRSKADILLPG